MREQQQEAYTDLRHSTLDTTYEERREMAQHRMSKALQDEIKAKLCTKNS